MMQDTDKKIIEAEKNYYLEQYKKDSGFKITTKSEEKLDWSKIWDKGFKEWGQYDIPVLY